jgi:hypothetical protein
MIIRAILERTWNRPEIEQQDIQTLIWAILAHTKISDMRDGNLALALSVLTQDEIRDLNGGALGMIPDEVMSQAESRLPPAVHQVFAAEAQIIMDYLNSECGNAPPDLKNKFDSLCGG